MPISSYQAIMDMLRDGTLRAFAADTPTALFHLERNNLLTQWRFNAETPLYQNDFFFAVKEGNRPLLDRINRGMELITDEERREINRRWIVSADDKEQVLIISIDRAYAPLTFVNPMGRPSGLLVDIWRRWAKATGNRIQFRPSSWSETLESLRAGEVDIHSGLSYSKERAIWIGFSDQLYRTVSKIYHRVNDPQPAQRADYGREAVGAMFKSHQETRLRADNPRLRILSYSTNQELIDALLSGEIKAFIQEEQLMEAAIDRLGLRGDITARPESLFPSNIHAGVIKGKRDLLQTIKQGFAVLSRSELAALEKRWLPGAAHYFYADTPQAIRLTGEEQAWLAETSGIKLAVTNFKVPLDIVDDTGQYTGFNADLIRLLNQKLGLNIVPVFFSSWQDLVQKTLTGQVAGAISFPVTSQYAQYLSVTKPYAFDPVVTVVRENETRIRQPQDFSGKRLSTIKGLSFHNQLRHSVGATGDVLLFDTESEALDSLASQASDGHVSTLFRYTNAQKQSFVPGLKMTITHHLEGGALGLAVHSQYPLLYAILKKGLAAISRAEVSAIREQWMTAGNLGEQGINLKLTPQEIGWLASHRQLRLGIDPHWAPFEFFDSAGKHSGISSGYVEAVAQRLDLILQAVPGLKWAQVIDGVKDGRIDVLPAVAQTAEREHYLNFTKTYTAFPVMIAVPADRPYFNELSELAGHRVGVVKAYYTTEILSQNHPELTLVRFDTLQDGLLALDRRELDAFVDSLGAITHEIRRSGLNDIIIAASTPYNFELAFGVRKDWPLLATILNKAIDDIDDKEKRYIKNTWMTPVEVKYGYSLKKILMWLIPIGSSVLAIIIFGVIWNRRLSTEIVERTAAEERFVSLIEAAPDAMVIVDIQGRITLVNNQTERLFDYNRRDLVGQAVEKLLPHPKRDAHVEVRQTFMAAATVRPMGCGVDLYGMTRPGRCFPVDISLSPLETPEGLVVAASIRDITARKTAEEALALAEEQNRLVLTSVGEGIIGLDTRGDVTFVNPSALALLGFGTDELIGASIHPTIQHSFADGTPYDRADSPIRTSYTQGESHHRTDEVLWRKDGSCFFADYKSTPVRKDTQVIGAVVTFSDISERKRMEDELNQHVKSLERFSSLAVGREMTMIDLKKEVNRLCRELGQDPKYRIVSEETA